MDYGEKLQLDNPSGSNLENWTPDRDVKSIGNKVIFSGETEPNIVPPTPPLGEIISEEPTLPTAEVSDSKLPFPLASIHPKGQEVSSETLDVLKASETKLSQTGDISNFYNEIRAAADEYQSKVEGKVA